MAPPQRKGKDAGKKDAGKKEDKAAKKKASTKSSGDMKLYYIGGGVALTFVIGMIGTAHMMKRARRERRRAILAGEISAEEAAPSWVVSESTMLITFCVLIVTILVSTIGTAVGQRTLAAMRKRQAAMSEKEAAAASTAKRKVALADAKAQLERSRASRAALNAEERAAQKAFEERLLSEIREHERSVQEAKEAEVAIIAAEAAAARREAARIDELTAHVSLPTKLGAGGDEDGWDVGDYDENDEAEGLGLGGGADGHEPNDYDDNDEEEEEGALPNAKDRLQLDLTPSAKGTRVSLEGMQMPETCTARATDLWVSLCCARCQKGADLHLGGLSADEATRKSWCDNCGGLLAATLRPCLLVPPASIVGHIDVSGCHVMDVPRLSVLMSCGKCYAELPLPPLQRGRTVQSGCRACHAPLSLKMNSVQVEKFGGGGLARGGGGADDDDDDDEMEALLKKMRKKNGDQLKLLGLVIGKPLPQKGACKHYQHSYRWLRFPCCARAYPCAVCHEQSDCPAAGLGAWANRMLCGKCSREMPYSDQPCDHCGNTFTKPGGAHWSGGAGCRDQMRLDAKDSRKYKGASASGVKKTTSQKSHRVGVNGKKAAALRGKVSTS